MINHSTINRPGYERQASFDQFLSHSAKASANLKPPRSVPPAQVDHKNFAMNRLGSSLNTPEAEWTDDDTGNSSGQDEFHLERYNKTQDTSLHSNINPISQAKKPEPATRKAKDAKLRNQLDLSITTAIPNSDAKPYPGKITVEEVRVRKTETSKNRARSVVSMRPEHGFEIYTSNNSGQPSGSKAEELLPPRKYDQQTRSNQSPQNASIIVSHNGFDGSIRQEGVAQQSRLLSTHSTTNPAIILTPAEEQAPWNEEPTKRRPASSIYSTRTPVDGIQKEDPIPPVPQIPAAYERPDLSISPAPDSDVDEWWQSDDISEVRSMHRNPGVDITRHHSTESQEQILPDEFDIDRPMSQGWWNLPLSPILSRGGTQKTRRFSIKPRPQDQRDTKTPKQIVNRQSKGFSLTSIMSPLTPRRLGFGPGRHSTWSKWTPWDQKEDQSGIDSCDEKEQLARTTEHAERNSAMTVPFMVMTSPVGDSLAAEYYHACAVDQLSENPYFECYNHSCAQQLPALQSIFDKAPFGGIARNMPASITKADQSQTPQRNVLRIMTDSTISSIGPDELSPTVRQANMANVVQARALDSRIKPEANNVAIHNIDHTHITTSPDEDDYANYQKFEDPSRAGVVLERSQQVTNPMYPSIASMMPRPKPSTIGAVGSIPSPGPISPAAQREMTVRGALPMAELSSRQYLPTSSPSPMRANDQPIKSRVRKARPPPIITCFDQQQNNRNAANKDEEESRNGEHSPGLKHSKKRTHCLRRKSTSRAQSQKPRKKKCLAIWLGILLLLIIIGCIVLATRLTREGDKTPSQSQWLNLTGYPPVPTGISTIIRPDAVVQESRCVQPSTLWSCALPKENQNEITPNQPNQPNFRFEIKFRNGTVPANMTIPLTTTSSNRKLSRRSRIQPRVLTSRANDPFTNDLFDPNPSPPERADQIFLGNTTDNNTFPFDGEETPFFITFIPTFPIDPSSIPTSTPTNNTSDLTTRNYKPSRRQTTSNNNNNDNLTSAIPAPAVLSDGSAAPANLLPTSPYPTSQPLRLYNRDQPNEHYGFYMYYDKSIFLSSAAPLNSSALTSSPDRGVLPQDLDGGSLRSQAVARCTFSQTRFKVQFFTSPSFSTIRSTDGRGGGVGGVLVGAVNTTLPSATNFSPPGSFPYPATITLDRHGGEIKKKAVYCYGVDGVQEIQEDVRSVVGEARGIGGTLVNQAPGLVGTADGGGAAAAGAGGFDPEAGGIDGGTGGCACSWQNWR